MKTATQEIKPEASPFWGADDLPAPLSADATIDRGDAFVATMDDEDPELTAAALADAEAAAAAALAAEPITAPVVEPVVEGEEPVVAAAEPVVEPVESVRSATIPRSRFDQVNTRLIAAQEELAALQKKHASTPAPDTAAVAQAELDYQAQLVTDQTEIHTLLLDGETTDAAAKQLALNARMVSRATESARTSAREAVAEAAAQTLYNAQLAVLEAKFPFINPDIAATYDDSLVTRVRSIQRSLQIEEGYTAADALAEAVETVAARFSPALAPEAAPVVPAAPNAVAAAAAAKTAATVAKNLALAGKQPVKLGGDGVVRANDGVLSIFDMSEAEFTQLSATELARRRGDVI